MERRTIMDSRGNAWEVRIVGPIRAGSMTPGQDLMSMPPFWSATFRRPEGSGTIEAQFGAEGPTDGELVISLEEQPEWQHEPWAGAGQ